MARFTIEGLLSAASVRFRIRRIPGMCLAARANENGFDQTWPAHPAHLQYKVEQQPLQHQFKVRFAITMVSLRLVSVAVCLAVASAQQWGGGPNAWGRQDTTPNLLNTYGRQNNWRGNDNGQWSPQYNNQYNQPPQQQWSQPPQQQWSQPAPAAPAYAPQALPVAPPAPPMVPNRDTPEVAAAKAKFAAAYVAAGGSPLPGFTQPNQGMPQDTPEVAAAKARFQAAYNAAAARSG